MIMHECANDNAMSNEPNYASSSGSPMPLGRIANCPSLSGRQGESYTLHIRVLPRPFFNCKLIDQMSPCLTLRMRCTLPCCRGMGHDISSNRLLLIGRIHTTSCVWRGHDLVCHYDSNTILKSSVKAIPGNRVDRTTHFVCKPHQCP